MANTGSPSECKVDMNEQDVSKGKKEGGFSLQHLRTLEIICCENSFSQLAFRILALWAWSEGLRVCKVKCKKKGTCSLALREGRPRRDSVGFAGSAEASALSLYL